LNFIDKQENLINNSKKISLIGGLFVISPITYLVFLYQEFDFYFIFSIYLIFIVGFYDDYKRLTVRFRLLTQFISAILLVSSGIIINEIDFGNFKINLNELSYLFTIFIILFYINSYNFIDGHDGVCSSLSLIFLLPCIFILNFSNQFEKNIIVFLVFSLIFFSFFNSGLVKKYKIFLGDSGSTTIGILISYFVIKYGFVENLESYKLSLLLWLSSLPIFDSANVILIRLRNSKSPFSGDKNHIHHVLSSEKFSKMQTYLIILFLGCALAIFGFILSNIFNLFYNLIFMLIFFFFYHLVVYSRIRK
tara:strand:- start:3765 stop:4682 length:918 start_codon:yes stop_codon:yes gene_type:complete